MPAPRVHLRGAELPGVQGEDGRRRRRRRRDEAGRAQGIGRRHRVVFDEGGKRVHNNHGIWHFFIFDLRYRVSHLFADLG